MMPGDKSAKLPVPLMPLEFKKICGFGASDVTAQQICVQALGRALTACSPAKGPVYHPMATHPPLNEW